MAESIQAARWSLTLVALLLLSSGGCMLNEFVVVDDPWLAACQTPPAEPADRCCVRRPLTLCDVARACLRPSPTCRTPRPAEWTGCPACSRTTGGTPMEPLGGEKSDSTTVAQPPSVLDELEPPLPDAIYRGSVPQAPVPPPPPVAEMEPRQTEEPRRTEVKVIEQPSPFREEEPAQEKAMEVPAETGPGEDAALGAPSPASVPAPAPAEAPAPASPEVPAPVPVPAGAPAPVPPADQSAQGPTPEDRQPKISQPKVSLTLRVAAETGAGATSSPPEVADEALPPAPLPEDVLTATAIPLEADPDAEPLPDAAEPPADSADEATAPGLPLAPMPFSIDEAAGEQAPRDTFSG